MPYFNHRRSLHMESGLPLQPLAELKLVAAEVLQSGRGRVANIYQACSNAIFQPSPVTPYGERPPTPTPGRVEARRGGSPPKWARAGGEYISGLLQCHISTIAGHSICAATRDGVTGAEP